MSFLDQMTKELLKRYGRLALGKPFAPAFLNILVTSVCDMRCIHCFFTEELDDKERKKNQMKTENIVRVSETLGGNLSVLVIAGGEPFTRVDLPDIARAFYENNRLESIYLMSNGQIQKRILPDVERILTECPKLHVTVALGLDGLEADHDRIRQKPGSWARAIDTARQLQKLKKRFARLDVQTCTCVMNSNQDRLFEWYDFLKHDLRPDKINVNYIRPPAARPEELNIDLERYRRLSQMILEDSRSGQAKNVYGGPNGAFKAAVDIYMHELIAKTQEEQKSPTPVFCRHGRRCHLRRRHGVELRKPAAHRQPAGLRLELFGPVVLRSHADAARAGQGRLLLYARKQLLLPIAGVQSEAPGQDQTSRTRHHCRPQAGRSR
jgi:MoaA/NifB/PqqE/SkfB family radical SAM enzyme